MKVYCAFKYKSYDHTERKFKKELVGIAKTQEGALKILKREFPYMHGCVGSENPTPDTDDVYLLEVRDIEVEE